jgi:putative transposase
MLVFETKLYGTKEQFAILDEVLRTALFIRNKCLRLWEDRQAKSRNDLYRYCKTLAESFPWAKKLNSQARQAMAERTWAAIARFYDNCKSGKPGKKGYPKYKRDQIRLSAEYKTSGYKLSETKDQITFTDGFQAGTFKMRGGRDLNDYQPSKIKRVRIVRRADGYYCQFVVDQERINPKKPTNHTVGLDVGIPHFYTDSEGNQVDYPQYLRRSEKQLKREQRRLSKKQKGSKNRAKARNCLGRKHLKVQRQRKDWAVKRARCVVMSADVVAYEDLKVSNLVRNHCLAKSISDAAWYQFRQWVEYFGKVFGVVTVAVPPHYTSQKCSSCGSVVKKTLSQRTHVCQCGCKLDRDHNAAINILELGLRTVGHTGTQACGHDDRCLETGDSLKVSRVDKAGNPVCEDRNPPLDCGSN